MADINSIDPEALAQRLAVSAEKFCTQGGKSDISLVPAQQAMAENIVYAIKEYAEPKGQ